VFSLDIFYKRVSQPTGLGKVFDGPRPGIIDFEYILQDAPLKIENVYKATSVVIRSVSPFGARNYCDMEISTWYTSTTLCTIYSY